MKTRSGRSTSVWAAQGGFNVAVALARSIANQFYLAVLYVHGGRVADLAGGL
jgi:hypothetical protein